MRDDRAHVLHCPRTAVYFSGQRHPDHGGADHLPAGGLSDLQELELGPPCAALRGEARFPHLAGADRVHPGGDAGGGAHPVGAAGGGILPQSGHVAVPGRHRLLYLLWAARGIRGRALCGGGQRLPVDHAPGGGAVCAGAPGAVAGEPPPLAQACLPAHGHFCGAVRGGGGAAVRGVPPVAYGDLWPGCGAVPGAGGVLHAGHALCPAPGTAVFEPAGGLPAAGGGGHGAVHFLCGQRSVLHAGVPVFRVFPGPVRKAAVQGLWAKDGAFLRHLPVRLFRAAVPGVAVQPPGLDAALLGAAGGEHRADHGVRVPVRQAH